jgi:DNA-binding transcriptional LysR family regulator
VVGRLPMRSPSNGFEEEELLDEHLTVVTGPQHPLARRKRLAWADLADYPWVLPPLASQMREPLERVLAQHDLPLSNNYIETMSTHFTRAYLYLSDAVAVIASATARDQSQPLAVLPLEMPQLLRPVGVLWNTNRPLSPGAEFMMACLRDAAAAIDVPTA